VGGRGDDRLEGGEGYDTASYAGSTSGVTISLGGGVQRTGAAGRDRLIDIENLVGSDHNDRLSGDDGANRLTGGEGRDVLTGGGGADIFIFGDGESTASKADRVTDFVSGEDRLDLSGVDADTTKSGDQRFRFIGEIEFSGAAGELRAVGRGGSTLVLGDVDGDGEADLQIVLEGVSTASASDIFDGANVKSMQQHVISRHVSGPQPQALALDWGALLEGDFVL
jgi:hypothetical protein